MEYELLLKFIKVKNERIQQIIGETSQSKKDKLEWIKELSKQIQYAISCRNLSLKDFFKADIPSHYQASLVDLYSSDEIIQMLIQLQKEKEISTNGR